MASNGYWLESTSVEYDYVRYHLTASTAHLGVIEKLNIWKINNSELQYRYERRCNGMLKISSWYNAEDLDYDNTLEQVCMRGFHVDPSKAKGIILPTGIITLEDENSTNYDQCFLLLEIAIGRSFVYDGNLLRAQIPQGYDSLYLPEQPLDRNKDGKFSLQEYQNAATFDQRDSSRYNHRYFLSDVNQICPKYIVRFKLLSSKQSTNLMEIVQSQIQQSTQSPINYQQLQYIDPITLLPPEQPNELAAAHLGLPVSSPSRSFQPLNATLSTTAAAVPSDFEAKKYVPIEKLYAQAIEEISYLENDASGQSKNQWIQRQLATIDEKLREINLNYVDILDSIDQSVEQTKQKLQRFIREKLELCLSIEIELRRQLEQMGWYNNMITSELKKYQQYLVECHPHDALKKYFMLEFLKLWKQHTLVRNGLNRLKPNELSVISNIHGDIRANTDIKLYIDPFYASTAATGSANHTNGSGGVALPATTKAAATAAAFVTLEKDGKRITQTLPNAQQDVTTSTHQIHEELHQFSQRAKQQEVYRLGQTLPLEQTASSNANNKRGSITGRGLETKPFHDSPIQSVIEQEMETIQSMIQKESLKHRTGLRLPLSISRPFLSNSHPVIPSLGNPTEGGTAPSTTSGMNMHSLINLLKASPTIHQQQKLLHSLGPETVDKVATIGELEDGKLKESFMDNLTDLLGLGAEPEYQNLNTQASNPSGVNRSDVPENPFAIPNKTNGRLDPPINPFPSNPNNSNHNNNNKSTESHQEYTLSVLEKEAILSRVTVSQLLHYLQHSFAMYKNYQLSEMALKKRNQLQVKFLLNEAKIKGEAGGGQMGLAALQRSKLLSESSSDRELIFFMLPFFTKLPQLSLIYSTMEHRRDLEELYSKTAKNRNPTLILIRSGEYRIGAYLNQAPLPTAHWNGNPQCFLFSLSLNLKLPYHGRATGNNTAVSLTSDDETTNHHLSLLQEPHAFYGTHEMLMIGNGDLVLDGRLLMAKSEIEMSYGVGLTKKAVDLPVLDSYTSKSAPATTSAELTKCLLGGNHTFPISDLEVWTIQY